MKLFAFICKIGFDFVMNIKFNLFELLASTIFFIVKKY